MSNQIAYKDVDAAPEQRWPDGVQALNRDKYVQLKMKIYADYEHERKQTVWLCCEFVNDGTETSKTLFEISVKLVEKQNMTTEQKLIIIYNINE